MQLTREADVFVFRMTDGENRFNPGNLDALEGAVAEVEAHEGPAALVLTGEGKFFSNGLDLDWMGANPHGAADVANRVQALFARLLSLDVTTVAAINGHIFAAGAMLALACDQRVMRADRGFFCLPEVDIGIPFTQGMNDLIVAQLDVPTAREAMLTGRRYGGQDAATARIVDEAVAEEAVLPTAIARAQALAGKPRHVVGTIKQRLYAGPIETLSAGVSIPAGR